MTDLGLPSTAFVLVPEWPWSSGPPPPTLWMHALPATPMPRAEAELRFAAVLESSQSAIWRLCRFREKNAETQRDLYQEIALALWQALPGFRGEASERTWALRIAHNVAATHVGRAVRERQVSLEGTAEHALDGAASGAADPERRLALFAQLAALDLPSQQLVLLHLEGLTTREIADVTGLTPTNVTTRLTRLRARLRDTATPANVGAVAAPHATSTLEVRS